MSFFWVHGYESERRTNKSHEPQCGSQAICLFHTPIHLHVSIKDSHDFFVLRSNSYPKNQENCEGQGQQHGLQGINNNNNALEDVLT